MDESLQEHLKALEVGKLKLSEAIRIGARLRPQNYNGTYMHSGKSCAIGAAYEGVTGIYEEDASLIGWFVNTFGNAIGHKVYEIGSGIVQRNDRGQSRESIADWLDAQGL